VPAVPNQFCFVRTIRFSSWYHRRVFDWLRKKAARPTREIRDTLFGDMALGEWPPGDAVVPPWSIFVAVRRSVEAGRADDAQIHLRQVLELPNLESRHYLQAWHELRRLGVQPTTEAKRLLGVVVEVALDEGLDLLAAYADHSVRYFNFSGAAVIWEHPDESLDRYIDNLLVAASGILEKVGPWEGHRPPAPPKGHARLNMMTPGGLFFGQGPISVLSRDPLAAPAILAATELMKVLIQKSEVARNAG